MTNQINQVIPRDEVEEFFAPIATKQSVSITALVGVVVNKITKSKNGQPPSKDEMIEFAALCKQAGLNPATSEVAPLVQGGHVSLIVSVDGWIKVARSQPEFAGYKLIPSENTIKVAQGEVPEYITSQIYIRGLDFPLEWRTYYREAVKPRSPVWTSMPNHMLQVRALSNGIKRSFGLNAYTPDEAADMIQTTAEIVEEKHSGRSRVMSALKRNKPQTLEQKQPEVFEQPAPTQAELDKKEAAAQQGYNDLIAQAESKKKAAQAEPEEAPLSDAELVNSPF